MHSATTATGRPLPPPRKTLPKYRPAPLSCRAARQLAAPKPHVTSQLQCYIPALIDNDRRSPRKFNRQPRRLESTISPTKQTRAPQINRQQMRTLHPAFFAGPATSKITIHSTSNRRNQHAAMRTTDRAPHLTNYYSSITTPSLSNRHTPRLENAISPRKQTLGTRSNRHFLHVSASHNHRIETANRPPQAASNNVSNRQWQILEINVNLSKQTIAPRSNRHKNALLASRLPRGSRRGPKAMSSWDVSPGPRQVLETCVRAWRKTNYASQVKNHGFTRHQSLLITHQSPLTNHASAPLVIYSSHTPNPGSSHQ